MPETPTLTPPAAPNLPDMEDLAARLPKYEFQTLLGRGGMGAVFRARHRHLDRLVAVKVLSPDLRTDPSFDERFVREARALAKLDHPGIVGVHDFGEADGVFYLVMEFVDGANLRELLGEGRLTGRDVLALIPQICEALQYAHDAGVVHRDIKPENILINADGKARIADFGLAKMLGDASQAAFTLTMSRQNLGTPHYMAPEQFAQDPNRVDHRADIYSLGVVLYEMLTGELPIGRFAPPSAKSSEQGFDSQVMRSLENEPDARYQQASELAEDLAQSAPTESTPPKADTAPKPAPEMGAPRYRQAAQPRTKTGPKAIQHAPWIGLVFVALGSISPWVSASGRTYGSPLFNLKGHVDAYASDTTLFGIPALAVVAAVFIAGILRHLRHRRIPIPQAWPLWLCSAPCALMIFTLGLTFSSNVVSPLVGSIMFTIGTIHLTATEWLEYRNGGVHYRSLRRRIHRSDTERKTKQSPTQRG